MQPHGCISATKGATDWLRIFGWAPHGRQRTVVPGPGGGWPGRETQGGRPNGGGGRGGRKPEPWLGAADGRGSPGRGQGPRPRRHRRDPERMADTPVTHAGAAVRRVAFGAMTRTGSVTLIALCGTRRWPVLAGRGEAPLMPAGLPAQPYHAAADLATQAAESVIGRGELAAGAAAPGAPRSAAAGPPQAATVTGLAGVAKARSVPPR